MDKCDLKKSLLGPEIEKELTYLNHVLRRGYRG